MVLDLPGGLFGQDDVRETESAVTEAGVTSYYAISPSDWHPTDLTAVAAASFSTMQVQEDGEVCGAGVNLPNGVTVTSVIIYGNASSAATETWSLFRSSKVDAGTTVEMATASFNSKDTSITSPIIDNSLFTYGMHTSTLDTGDIIYGGIITYTT